MIKGTLLSVVFLFSSSCLRAEDVRMSLDEALALAARENRQIILKTEDVKKAQSILQESKSDLLPSFSVSAGLNSTLGLYSKDVTQEYVQGSLQQTLYKGGRVFNTIRYNEYGISISQAVLDRTRLEVLLEVKRVFYTLLLARELSLMNKAIVENTQEHLVSVLTRYKKGEVPETDLLNVEASLSKVKQVYEASLNQLAATEALLRNLLYIEDAIRIIPQGELAYDHDELAYDRALVTAMSKRPELKQYDLQEKAAQASIEIAKAENRPTVSASWDYYTKSHTAGVSGYAKNWNDYHVAGITVTWPLFDGWSTKEKVHQAIITAQQAKVTAQKTRQDIVLEVRNAYLDLRSAVDRIQAAADEQEVYKNTLAAVQNKYDAGISSALELHDAAVAYRVSEFNHRNASYDALVAKALLEKAMGGNS